MELLLDDRYLHPNGQIPAYEWNFSDVNPPLHAWSAMLLYERERQDPRHGRPRVPRARLPAAPDELHLVGQPQGPRRPQPVPGRVPRSRQHRRVRPLGRRSRAAGSLEQADGTAWMALYCQAMLQMALELTKHDPAYAEMAAKFAMHLVWIGAAMSPPDGEALWSEEDGFYYDVMRLPDGSTQQLKVRSLVGLLPMCAATVIEPEALELIPELLARWEAFVDDYKDSIPSLAQRTGPSVGGKILTSLVGVDRLRRILAILLDESEFLGPVRGPRDLALPRRAPLRVRHRRPGVPRRLRAGGVAHGDVRRQLELARTGVVPHEHGDPPRAAPAPRLLRRRPEGGVPDRLGQRDEPARGRRRDRPAPGRDLPARRERSAPRVRRASSRSRPIRTGATCCCSTSTSTATTAPASARATRPAGPGSWRCCSCRRRAACPCRRTPSGSPLPPWRSNPRRRPASHAPSPAPHDLRDQHGRLARRPEPEARPYGRALDGAVARSGTGSPRCAWTPSG